MLQHNPKNTGHPHAPPHRYSTEGTYIVTSATLHKKHLFNEPEKLSLVQEIMFNKAKKHHWELKAWAIFNNHYHFIASSCGDPKTLPRLINEINCISALEINKLDDQQGRKVWNQYWDTCLTYKDSYYARLNYVMQNPVKHGLTKDAREYPWCSAAWFDESNDSQFKKTIYGYKFDRLNIVDDFDT